MVLSFFHITVYLLTCFKGLCAIKHAGLFFIHFIWDWYRNVLGAASFIVVFGTLFYWTWLSGVDTRLIMPILPILAQPYQHHSSEMPIFHTVLFPLFCNMKEDPWRWSDKTCIEIKPNLDRKYLYVHFWESTIKWAICCNYLCVNYMSVLPSKAVTPGRLGCTI